MIDYRNEVVEAQSQATYDRLSERGRSPIPGDLSGGDIGNGKDAKQLHKSRSGQLANRRFLSGQ